MRLGSNGQRCGKADSSIPTNFGGPQIYATSSRMHVHLSSSLHVFDPRPNSPFLLSVIRYYIPSSSITSQNAHLASTDPDALTFIVAHGAGFHKEHHRPMLEDLFEMLVEARGKIKVRDAWVVDAPHHGDSAVLNENLLRLDEEYSHVCASLPTAHQRMVLTNRMSAVAWDHYGRSLQLLLNNLDSGLPVDFRTRNVVGIGHSMGAVALYVSPKSSTPCFLF